MGSAGSKGKAKGKDGKGKEQDPKDDKEPKVEYESPNTKAKLKLKDPKERRSRLQYNQSKNKATRQLSCVQANRATAQRTRAAERLASKNAASAAVGVADDGEADKEIAHQLAQHLISISPFNKRWKVIETISEGTYGVVFSVQDTESGISGVIKVAKSMSGEFGNQTAEWEGFVLEKMFKEMEEASIVRLLDKGMLCDHNGEGMEFMVLEKVEIDVRTYIYEENSASARRMRVCNVALQTLKGVSDLHANGFLHRDLKPDNMGICSRTQPIVLIFDLGMARMYTQDDGSIRPPRTVVHFRGTPEWASGHAAKGREQTRFDDLVAWLYVVVELFDPSPDSKAPLPWSYCRNNGGIRYLKSTYSPARLLLRYCPSQFYAINTYLQSANRSKAPDYAFLADRVMEAIEECRNEKDKSVPGKIAVEQAQ